MDDNIFDQLTNCDEETIKKISRYCKDYLHEKTIRELDKKYAENQKYVGKCYVLNTQKGRQFYKVISVKSNNQFRVSCLVFNDKPSADFRQLFHKAIPHHSNEGKIDFDGIYVDDVMINNNYLDIAIKDMTEITEGEWRYALQRYVDQLIDFDWSKI